MEWIDRGREPQCKPDPDYPNGIDVMIPGSGGSTCTVELPYPAKRCGLYQVSCTVCGKNVLVTTAGRVDDPRSVTMPCERSVEA